LLAGRELALAFRLRHRTISESILLAGKDVGKAAIGLAVSIVLAIGLPVLDRGLQQGFSDSAAESGRTVEVSAGVPVSDGSQPQTGAETAPASTTRTW
jgi:hypothetical protein